MKIPINASNIKLNFTQVFMPHHGHSHVDKQSDNSARNCGRSRLFCGMFYQLMQTVLVVKTLNQLHGLRLMAVSAPFTAVALFF